MRVQHTSAVSIRPRSRDRHVGSSWLLGPLVLGAQGAGATKLQHARTPSNPSWSGMKSLRSPFRSVATVRSQGGLRTPAATCIWPIRTARHTRKHRVTTSVFVVASLVCQNQFICELNNVRGSHSPSVCVHESSDLQVDCVATSSHRSGGSVLFFVAWPSFLTTWSPSTRLATRTPTCVQVFGVSGLQALRK